MKSQPIGSYIVFVLRVAALFVALSLLIAPRLLATSPIYRQTLSTTNPTMYSKGRTYCVEIHEAAGIGGCLDPNPGTFRYDRNSPEAKKIEIERSKFDYERRTIALYKKNGRGEYARLWQQQTQPTRFVGVTVDGDVIVQPIPIYDRQSGRESYRAEQTVDIFAVTGRRIAQVRFDALLTPLDIQRLESPRLWLRADEQSGRRILMLSFDVAPETFPRSRHKAKIETVEYDIDRSKLLTVKRDRY